ncbi:MAG: endonuclease domain-containing protein, partial [Parasphingopyxis sp.]|nr:endonuclease domain-containing protein [Sphingomonadales bacterium]
MGAIDRLDPVMRERARELRNNPTPFEKKVWRALRGSQLGRYKFKRQTVIEPWIVDFFCPGKGLVIEIDGDTHDVDRDRKRDAALEGRGFRVVRFTNRDVASNIEGVLEKILITAEALPDRFTHPPTPSLEREGEE